MKVTDMSEIDQTLLSDLKDILSEINVSSNSRYYPFTAKTAARSEELYKSLLGQEGASSAVYKSSAVKGVRRTLRMIVELSNLALSYCFVQKLTHVDASKVSHINDEIECLYLSLREDLVSEGITDEESASEFFEFVANLTKSKDLP